MLIDTDVAGRPKEYFEFLKHSGRPIQGFEYFVSEEIQLDEYDEIIEILGGRSCLDDEERLHRWRKFGYHEEFSRILSLGTTSNEIFAAKMMWGYLENFLQLLNPGYMRSAIDSHLTLTKIFPNLRYVRIQRTDKLRQAISLWKAIQTQQWRWDYNTPTDETRSRSSQCPVFHFGAIRYLQRKLREQDQAWNRFFIQNQVPFLTVVYEVMQQDLEGTLFGVLDFLEIPRSEWPKEFKRPTMIRQRNSDTEVWVRQYLKMSSSPKTILQTS